MHHPLCYVLHCIIGLSEPHVTKPVGAEDKLGTWTQHQYRVRRGPVSAVAAGKDFKMKLFLTFALFMLLADQLEAGR